MVRKKKKREDETVTFCYYCDRIFADETTLIQHQKARHYKCSTCHKKLNTIQGLAIHCSQVHKITVEAVPNALPGRGSVNVEIFGMAGVPDGAAPGITVPVEDEPDTKRAATGQGATVAALAGPTAPTYLGQPPQAAAYPQYAAPAPYGYPPAGFQPPGMYPPGYMRPGMPVPLYPPQRPGQPPMSMPAVRPPPGMTMQYPGQPGAGMPPQAGQPPASAPGGVPQPLFPISSAAAPARMQAAPAQTSAAVPSGSLFPISLQEPAAAPASGLAVTAGAGTAAGPEPSTAAAVPDVDLVWQEENVSMEERRAQLSKYTARQAQAQAPQADGALSHSTAAPAYQVAHPGYAIQVPSSVYEQ
ncbi:hypothetical protein ABBQ32_011713 [Trebouxia sp. C0010 RCD-2024]